MYFKILKGTKLFDKLMKVDEKRRKAHDKSSDMLKELGAKNFLRPAVSLGGGIQGFQFKSCPPGWKPILVGTFKNCYFPKSLPKNNALLTRIKALPMVTRTDFADVLKYEPQSQGRKLSLCPSIEFKPKMILVNALIEDYKPLRDMIEITEGEYKKLRATK